ncbi:MAG TPA: hypothetical protein VL832_16540 [Puia sp.]|jgi:hypothetical protein|nr:hypothetical protein [Puia sp.]
MIYPVFFILEDFFPSVPDLPAGDDIHYSILVDPAVEGALDSAYALVERSGLPLSLTLNIRKSLSEDEIRSITSFLFIPGYLRVFDRRVINLAGENPRLLADSAKTLSGYLSGQGILEPLIQPVFPKLRSVEELTAHYRQLLLSDKFESDGNNTGIFFYPSSETLIRSAISSLEQVDRTLSQDSPGFYNLIGRNKTLSKELYAVQKIHALTAQELNNQRQYVDVLRSDHAANELQEYYTREYEILPLWFKRVGHIVKVFTGKRTLRSLFRDDVKKYKD